MNTSLQTLYIKFGDKDYLIILGRYEKGNKFYQCVSQMNIA